MVSGISSKQPQVFVTKEKSIGFVIHPSLGAFAKEYGQARPCLSCEGIMLQATTTLRREYKGALLALKNFPVTRCTKCMHEQTNTSKLLKFVKLARDNYDNHGLVELDCEITKTLDF